MPEMMPLVYEKLRAIAAGHLRHERSSHTWQATDLAHEAFLRLRSQGRLEWCGREHFFAIAARTMRHLLIERARKRQGLKHGGALLRLPMEEADGSLEEPAVEVLDLHRALEVLAKRSFQQARMVELRFFGGLTKLEIAEVLGVSEATVARRWRLARAWLHRYLVQEG